MGYEGQAEREWRIIVKDPVAITSLAGDILHVNQAEVESLKLSKEGLIGANTAFFGQNLALTMLLFLL